MNDGFSGRPVILIVDADALTLTGVAAALHLSGYEAHCARDVEAAMKAAERISLDLVISDVNLEGQSGIDLAHRIQQTPLNRDVPLMFVSAVQLPDVVRRTHDAGGVYYLRKPFDPNVLLELVDRALWMPHLVRNQIESITRVDSGRTNAPSAPIGSIPALPNGISTAIPSAMPTAIPMPKLAMPAVPMPAMPIVDGAMASER
ncbi:MAG TPA: response regulator [Pirellulaceae bacterium]|nr:response regulator [Pirellulaceae bacterium]